MRRVAYVLSAGKNPSKKARYERRGVRVVNLIEDNEKYESVLVQFFEELKLYWSPKIIENSEFTSEEMLSDLSMPKDNANRLCFFAIPPESISYYTSLVFPIVKSYGLVPVTVDSMISPAYSVYTRMKALLDRSTIIVADETSNWVLSEISMLLRKQNSPQILIIKNEEADLPKELENVKVITKPKDLTKLQDEFLKEIESFFEKISEKLFDNEYSDEPKRLLEKKEYGAAIISSVTVLEITFRRLLDIPVLQFKNRYPNILNLVDFAHKQQIIDASEYNLLREVLYTRNKLVHSGYSIKPKEASYMVTNVLEIIDKIRTYEIKND